jgi:predicted SAM-dependent methyltransferase
MIKGILGQHKRLVRFVRSFLPNRIRLKGILKLHLACGNRILPGWANIDLTGPHTVIKHNLTKSIPISDRSIEFIFCEHFIEHVTRDDAKKILIQCFRVLRPGGIFRITTPDLEYLVDAYLKNDIGRWSNVGWRPSTVCQLLNESMRSWDHKFLYDSDELFLLLNEAGFNDIKSCRWRESTHPQLQDLENRPFNREVILEATKA